MGAWFLAGIITAAVVFVFGCKVFIFYNLLLFFGASQTVATWYVYTMVPLVIVAIISKLVGD